MGRQQDTRHRDRETVREKDNPSENTDRQGPKTKTDRKSNTCRQTEAERNRVRG